MVDQLARPKDKVEVYWFSEQPYGHPYMNLGAKIDVTEYLKYYLHRNGPGSRLQGRARALRLSPQSIRG